MITAFLIGAAGYPLLELAYRRRTHYSMAIAGGLAMLLIRHTAKLKCPWPLRVLVCGTGITGIEYLCGIIWNRKHTVWDYSNKPLNVQGQICLQFSAIWCLLSSVMLSTFSLIHKRRRPD